MKIHGSFPDSGSVFSVPHLVAEIFITEEEIVSLVNRSTSQEAQIYLESWSSRVKELEVSQLSEDYFEVVLLKLVGNPVHVFNLMDRLVVLLPNILEGLEDSEQAEIEESLASLTSRPDQSDLEGAMQALIRVQFAYR